MIRALILGAFASFVCAATAFNGPAGDIQSAGSGSAANANFALNANNANNAVNVVAGGNVTTNAVNANSLNLTLRLPNSLMPTSGAGSGTVTSVGMSVPGVIFSLAGTPVTSSGTLALSLLTQSPNTFFAGPSGGVSATPTWRTLSSGDMPTSGAGSGTVTSVGLTVPGLLFSVTGSPITSTGTLAFSLLTQSPNTVFAGPSGGASATPTWRALAAGDIPSTLGATTFPTVNSNAINANTLTVNGNATFNGVVQLGNSIIDSWAGGIPTVIDTGTIYRSWDYVEQTTGNGFLVGVGNSASGNGSGSGVASFTLDINHQGLIYVWTSNSTTGGGLGGPGLIFLSKSTTVTYQWRQLFMMPNVASSASNRYTFFVGPFYINSSTNPFAGPALSYSDNVNSGNWVMTSYKPPNALSVSANSSVAPPASGTWNIITTTLSNGVFTFSVNGVTVGTLTDTNIVSGTVASGTNNVASAGAGGAVQIVPSTYTTNTYSAVDRADMLITGLSR